MKPAASIALLAANLDHGGVADHVKSLASALAAHGVTVRTLSRASCTSTDLREIDWIGLHFVSYSWAPQGILRYRDIEELHKLCSGRKVALYLHELWIGESTGTSLKYRLVGTLQRRRLLRLINHLHPARIFTNTAVYQAILSREGIPSDLLPLPGNLPLPTVDDRQRAEAWLDAAGLHNTRPLSLAAVFGTIHPEWDATSALASWCTHTHHQHEGRKAVLLVMGRIGPAGEARLAALQTAVPELSIIHVGEQSGSLLAGLLAKCSLGIATSPWALIGKSGTAAAFLEAGLPVLVTRDDWHWRRGHTPSPKPHPRLWRWIDTDTFSWDSCLASRSDPTPLLPGVAEVWVNLVSKSGEPTA